MEGVKLMIGIFMVFCVVFVSCHFADEQGSCQHEYDGDLYPHDLDDDFLLEPYTSKAQILRPAPYWEATAVVDGQFKLLSMNDFLGKYLVLFFYPLDFTFVCPTEIIAFSDRADEFKQINTDVVGVSVDSQFTHLAWINTARSAGGLGPINIPLVSDLNHDISKKYGVFLSQHGHSLRGLFIIDAKGILRQITVNDMPVGRSVDETLRLVAAFQYTDTHGEVCPADWRPGGDTIIPDPENKLKYFNKKADDVLKTDL